MIKVPYKVQVIYSDIKIKSAW